MCFSAAISDLHRVLSSSIKCFKTQVILTKKYSNLKKKCTGSQAFWHVLEYCMFTNRGISTGRGSQKTYISRSFSRNILCIDRRSNSRKFIQFLSKSESQQNEVKGKVIL